MESDFNIFNGNSSPIIKGSEVIFLYRGSAGEVYLAGDYNQWELEDGMKRIKDTDIWYIKKEFPENSRFDYKYIVDGNWITDSMNNNITPGGAGDNSTLIMPGYSSEYERIIKENVPRGALITGLKFSSRYLKKEMQYHIYLPYGYKKENTRYIMYALDGSDYIGFSKINLVLDYMIYYDEIPRMPVILVDPENRNEEYTIHEPYYNYVIKELMPAIEKEYTSEIERLDRAVIGVSWGGLTAIYLAVKTPGRFKRVLSQSGSFWPKDWLIYHIVGEAVTPDIRFCLQTGTIQDTEEMNDPMVKIMKAKGYTVDYVKYAESHSWGNWKGHLDEGLKKLYMD